MIAWNKEDTTYYVNDLDKLYVYLITHLLKIDYKNAMEELTNKTFSYAYKGGKCANVKVKKDNGTLIQFVNFKSKFGVEFGTDAENAELIEYAQQKGRLACSLGADAYNEFIRTILHPARYNDYIAHQIMRQEDHYPIFEYTPLQVKQAVVGYGRADKKQVQMMVKAILNLEKIPKLDDTTDAIAIAICHAHSFRFAEPIK